MVGAGQVTARGIVCGLRGVERFPCLCQGALCLLPGSERVGGIHCGSLLPWASSPLSSSMPAAIMPMIDRPDSGLASSVRTSRRNEQAERTPRSPLEREPVR